MGVCTEDEKAKAAAFIARYPCLPSLAGVQHMRNRLHLAHAGQKLMHDTAEATCCELKILAREITEACQCFCEEMCLSYILLARARYTTPYLHDVVLNNLPSEASVKVETCIKSKICANVLQIQIINNFPRIDGYAHLGIGRGGETVRVVKRHWNEMLQKMVHLCQLRYTFKHLDKANRGACKQTTVLSERVIPGINSNITACESKIEELQRDQLYRMKILAKNFRLCENGSKGVLLSSLPGAIQELANNNKLKCSPECPFDCAKIDPLTMAKNSVLDTGGNKICLTRTESANREKMDCKDFSGCPAACLKMYEKVLAENCKYCCKATSPITCKKVIKSQQEIKQELERASPMTYSPRSDFKKCLPCRDEQVNLEEKQSQERVQEELEERRKNKVKEQERLDKLSEKEDKEERLRFKECEKQDYKRSLEKISSMVIEVEEKNRVCCSTSPIEDLLPCPHCQTKIRTRPSPPPCPQVHLTMTNTDLGLNSKCDFILPEKDILSQHVHKFEKEKPRLVDAQEETGLVTQSSVYKLEVNHILSKGKLLSTKKASSEDIHVKSEFTETLIHQPPCETKQYKKGLVSQTTSFAEELSPCTFCHVICPRVDALPCPHCHMVYPKTPGDIKSNVFSKPTSDADNLVMSTCSQFHIAYPDSNKEVTPICYSASTSTKGFNVLSCTHIQTSYPNLEVKRSVCCSPKEKGSVCFSPKKNGSVSFSKNTSPAHIQLPLSPICTEKKKSSSIMKLKENKPNCCSTTTSSSGLECCNKICPKSAFDCCNKCPEKNKGSLKMKSKQEKPKPCSITTSPAKQLPFYCPVCTKKKISSSKMKKSMKKKLSCCSRTTSPIDAVCRNKVCPKSASDCYNKSPEKEKIECKNEKPKYCSNTTSPAKIPCSIPTSPAKQLPIDSPVYTQKKKPIYCTRTTSPIDLELCNEVCQKLPSDCCNKCPEKKLSCAISKLKKSPTKRCQDTESIKTSTVIINQKSKGTTVNQKSEKSFGLEDFTIDETGKVVKRKSWLSIEEQTTKLVSIKDVIDKGEEEFRKVRLLREALKIPCTHSEPCCITETPCAENQEDRKVSVVAQTSIHVKRSANTGTRESVAASYDSFIKQVNSKLLSDPVSELKLIKQKIADGTCETNKNESDEGEILSNNKRGANKINAEIEVCKSINRPIIASYGILDFPSAATSTNADNMSEKLERIHVYLSQSPANTSLSEKKIKECDDSYVDDDSFGEHNEVFCIGNDNFCIENSNNSHVHNDNNSYLDNDNSYAVSNNYNVDSELKVAFCKKKIAENVKGKWAQILIHSFAKVRIKPTSKDTVARHSNRSLRISGHKLRLYK